jgi:hypothetical protein
MRGRGWMWLKSHAELFALTSPLPGLWAPQVLTQAAGVFCAVTPV